MKTACSTSSRVPANRLAILCGLWLAWQYLVPAAAATISYDLAFAQDELRHLLTGDANAGRRFDWETLTVGTADFGAKYRQLPSAETRRAAAREFVQEFRSAFTAAGGIWESASNWQAKTTQQGTFVVVTFPGKMILAVTVVWRDQEPKITKIDVEKP